ncbi:hypothetical protein BJ944DRAFT_208174 [Cunninghamella echinulata]|nr:hypothetical protein BJ944DRAFT_208174 [Cunninghamella echinulata]
MTSTNTNKDNKDTIIPNKQKRQRWTEQETDSLLLGCMMHGVGNWKKIVKDPSLTFNHRSAVDLKDRFRTICPKREYKHLYTQQGTNDYYLDFVTSQRISVQRKKRRERRLFNDEEDQALLKGIEMYGVSWSKIAKDPQLNLSHRKGVDLRDRLRNKFPEKYEALGFHLTSRKKKQQQIKASSLLLLPSPTSSSEEEEEELLLQNENKNES